MKNQFWALRIDSNDLKQNCVLWWEDKLQVLAITITNWLHTSLISSLPILGCQAQVTCSPTKFMQEAPSVFDTNDAMTCTTSANETMPISPALKSIQGDWIHVPLDRAISGHKDVPSAAPNGDGMQGLNSDAISKDWPHLKEPSDASFNTEGHEGKHFQLTEGDMQISWANITGELNNNESPSAVASTQPLSLPKSFLKCNWEVYNELLPNSSHFLTLMPYIVQMYYLVSLAASCKLYQSVVTIKGPYLWFSTLSQSLTSSTPTSATMEFMS